MNIESDPLTRWDGGAYELPPGVVGYSIPSPRQRVSRYKGPEPVPPAFLESVRARAAMASRDVCEVFAVLQSMGVSQRRIAALTGQSQSEIHEILSGRQVRAVDVFERIADGLGTPRGWWRLAPNDEDAVAAVEPVDLDLLKQALAGLVEPEPEPDGRRRPVWNPGPARSRPRVSPVRIAAGRHLIGLISAIRASLSAQRAVIRPSAPARSGHAGRDDRHGFRPRMRMDSTVDAS